MPYSGEPSAKYHLHIGNIDPADWSAHGKEDIALLCDSTFDRAIDAARRKAEPMITHALMEGKSFAVLVVKFRFG